MLLRGATCRPPPPPVGPAGAMFSRRGLCRANVSALFYFILRYFLDSTPSQQSVNPEGVKAFPTKINKQNEIVSYLFTAAGDGCECISDSNPIPIFRFFISKLRVSTFLLVAAMALIRELCYWTCHLRFVFTARFFTILYKSK